MWRSGVAAKRFDIKNTADEAKDSPEHQVRQVDGAIPGHERAEERLESTSGGDEQEHGGDDAEDLASRP